jgi:hypothetical protein
LDSTGGAITHKRWDGSSWVTQAFDSESISAGAITATQIAAGAITAGAIAANAITAEKINASAVTADKIASSAITTDKLQANAVTAAKIDVDNLTVKRLTSGAFSERRVIIGEVGATDSVQFKGASTSNGWLLSHNSGNSNLSLSSTYGTVTFEIYEDVAITGGISASAAAVDFQGVYDNNTTGLAPVGITTTGRLRRNGTSSQKIKYDIATLSGELSDSVDAARQCDVSTCDPAAILDVGVVEFSVIDEGLPTERRLLGFIADDVADKLPIAVLRDAEGEPAGVIDQSMVAALLAVVQQQQQQITDLTARIEALEA